ncbi:MAG TPA: DoxX family protein [Flavobacterium sp.]|nr:DoxX family protein [Flavobacterium sp.]
MPDLSSRKRTAGLQPYAAIFIRLAFGYHLIQYTFSDVFNLTAGSANYEWLGSKGVPMPYFMSWLYILTEFIGGIALVIGFKARWFAVPLAVNFIVAYFLVHFGDEYMKSFEAVQMLAVSFFFLFNGSGRLSIDEYLKSRKQ